MECKMESFLYEDPATHEDGKSLALIKHSFAVTQLWSERPTSQLTSQERPKQNKNKNCKSNWATGEENDFDIRQNLLNWHRRLWRQATLCFRLALTTACQFPLNISETPPFPIDRMGVGSTYHAEYEDQNNLP